MNNSTTLNLASILKSHKGQFGITFEAITDEHRLLKRAIKTTPLGGFDIKKISTVSNAVVGWSYGKVVQARAAVTSGDGAPLTGQFAGPQLQYIPQAPSGMEAVPGFDDILYRGLKDPDKLYIRFYMLKTTKVESHYAIITPTGFRLTTPDETEIIKGCLSAPREFSAKQAALGVENEVIPRSYAASSILALTIGSQRFI